MNICYLSNEKGTECTKENRGEVFKGLKRLEDLSYSFFLSHFSSHRTVEWGGVERLRELEILPKGKQICNFKFSSVKWRY